MRRTIYCTAGVDIDQPALFIFFILYLGQFINKLTVGAIHELPLLDL